MSNNINLPPDLEAALAGEATDFVIKTKRAEPLKKCITLIVAGAVWLGFTAVFFFAMLYPLFLGKEVYFITGQGPAVAGPGNLGPIVIPALCAGILVLIGAGIFVYGIYCLLKAGPSFAATPKRFIIYSDGNIRSLDWSLFSGDIELTGDAKKGSLFLGLKKNSVVNRGLGAYKYFPTTVVISDIPNVFEIEKICRERMKR